MKKSKKRVKVKDSMIEVVLEPTNNVKVLKTLIKNLDPTPEQVVHALAALNMEPKINSAEVKAKWSEMSPQERVKYLSSKYGEANLKKALKALDSMGSDWKSGFENSDSKVGIQLASAIETVLQSISILG